MADKDEEQVGSQVEDTKEENGEVRRTEREGKPTEQYLEYQRKLCSDNVNTYFTTWHKCANKAKELVKECKDALELKKQQDKLSIAFANIRIGLDRLNQFTEIPANVIESFKDINLNHTLLEGDISNILSQLEQEQQSTRSGKDGHTNVSSRSGSSRSSRLATVAAEAAALKVKLQYVEEETRQKMELEKKRSELEKTQSLKEYSMAQAKLDAMLKYEENLDFDHGRARSLPTGIKDELVEKFIHSLPPVSSMEHDSRNLPASSQQDTTNIPKTSLNVSAQDFVPTNVTIIPATHQAETNTTWIYTGANIPPAFHQQSRYISSQAIPTRQPRYMSNVNPPPAPLLQQTYMTHGNSNQTPAQRDVSAMEEMTRSFAEQVSLGRLPPPEPGIFSGDPLMYPGWKSAFETLIERKAIPVNERMFYLKKYLQGTAREAIEGYFLIPNEESYFDAKALLEQRYGNKFVIANAFRNKLERWPRIAGRDGISLRKFSDFLRQCLNAMQRIDSLYVLNDERENRKLLWKLPEWLSLRWARIVAEWRETKGTFPSFKVFSDFISKEANIACDPVTYMPPPRETANNQHIRPPAAQGRGQPRGQSYSPRGQEPPSRRQMYSTGVKESTMTKEIPTGKEKETCHMCNQAHNIDDCKLFRIKPLQDRKDYALNNYLCFSCLKHGHTSKYCPEKKKCDTCSRYHPTSLHGNIRPNTNEETHLKATVSRAEVSHQESNSGKCTLTVPVWLSHQDHPEKERLVYAMLDTQSDTTFILDDTSEALDVTGIDVKLSLSTMLSKDQLVMSKKISGLLVRGFNSPDKIALPPVYTRDVMPANRNHIPTPEMARRWPHLEGIAGQLMPMCDCEVGILIGYNCPSALAPRDVIPPVGNEPYAQRTVLGWGIVGIVDDQKNDNHRLDNIGVSHRVYTYEVPEELTPTPDLIYNKTEVVMSCRTKVKESVLPFQVAKMMDLDLGGDQAEGTSFSYEDHQFLTKVSEGIKQEENGHYTMPLPFKETDPELPNNRTMAEYRLRQLKYRFKRNERYRTDYITFMEDVIRKNHAEQVLPDCQTSTGKLWYIPHHGVYHPKKPGKIRVVFDCSAKFNQESLNDHLLHGPDLTNLLLGVLCRFRQEKIAFMCDIEQMFHQFYVDKAHQDFLRFLWWKNGDFASDPKEYRMRVHLFGATSSPGCANFGLKQVAIDYKEEVGEEASKFLQKNFYVDDGLGSVSTPAQATNLIKKVQTLCQKGGLKLHKFVSNSQEVLDSLPTKDLAKGVKNLDLQRDELPIERALGVHWCIESDTFGFRLTLKDQPFTRRGILSTVSSMYDPLGMIAPVLLKGKQILQEMCKDNVDWDAEIPEGLRPQWERWRGDLFHLEEIAMPRCFKPGNFGEVKLVQLHHFSDASTSGYGQCSFLRQVDCKNQVHCSFVMGKSRVAPLKTLTIPRLELSAAVVSVKISAFLRKELEYSEMEEFFWTDSRVVLGYLSNNARKFHVFVANRIQAIRDQTQREQWNYIRTDENPADDGSRGVSATNFVKKSKWLTGPLFLWKPELPSTEPVESEAIPADDPEVKKGQTLMTKCDSAEAFQLQRLSYFSKWYNMRRAVANCLKLKERLRNWKSPSDQDNTQTPKPVTVEQIQQAETEIIKLVQQDMFPEELKVLRKLKVTDETCDRKVAVERKTAIKKASNLYKLDPFLDDNVVIRVGGRIRKAEFSYGIKHPVILPRKHHITTVVIRHFHERFQHQGRGMTITELRSNGFWVIGCSSAVSHYIMNCVVCRKLRTKTQDQKMADLTKDRLEETAPFTYCAVDYFGPWIIKEGRKELKRYGALFTCMTSRAIHIEVANSLTTDSYINALRRFISVRGPVRQMRSDQGTNFVGADRELREAVLEMDSDHIRQYLQAENCDLIEFKRNVPSASHMGGVWERQIRTVRSVLGPLMRECGSQLDDETFRTLMCEVTAIVNSRPLTVDNVNDPTSLEPLTPNHLLTMKPKIIMPPPGHFQRADLYCRKRWRRVQHLSNEFWNRWKREYLQNLQIRQKWVSPNRNVKAGDVVLIKDDNLPRNQWSIAKVERTMMGDDNRVRKVRLSVGDQNLDAKGRRLNPLTCLDRPVHKLVVLIENED